MDKFFAPTDLRRYYRGAFVRSPSSNRVMQVIDISEVDGTILLQSLTSGDQEQLAPAAFGWEHVRIPKLGFRCHDGMFLYYVSKRIGNLTQKGVTYRTLSIEYSTPLYSLLKEANTALAAEYTTPAITGAGSTQLTEQIFNPTFQPLSKIVENIQSSNALAGAINSSFAVLAGKKKANAFSLYFKNWNLVAVSEDGDRWKLSHADFKPVIERSLGELLYV